MKRINYSSTIWLSLFFLIVFAGNGFCWNDETHIAIAKAAGYRKWFNAAGADMLKIKAGYKERFNHYANSARGTVVTPRAVIRQAQKYNSKFDVSGHLYGAIIASIREYLKEKKEGKYGEYHLAFCAHYVGDLSQPLHNTLYDAYNRKNHKVLEGIINDQVLNNLDKISVYEIKIESEADLAKEIARIANISIKKGYQMEDENRLLTEQEIYQQLSRSASLFRGIMRYVEKAK